jgi:predicted ABC-type ATPase
VPSRALIIAGPNGAGKTTFAREFLPREGHCPEFINADLIALGLAPFDPERAALKASRLMAEAIEEAVVRRSDFAVETTLAGRSYLGLIRRWKEAGYQVGLVFLRLPSVEMAIARVLTRVQQGGHDIPEPVIRRRFERGWIHFQLHYRHAVDAWMLYDASGPQATLVESGANP